MQASVGLREQKKADTRVAISRAALELAIELGPDAVTVDAIAALAGVSPRTVFNYFGTKEQAILGFEANRSLDIARSVEQRPARETPLTALRVALTEIATDVPEVAEVVRARAQLVRDHPQLHPHYVAGYSTLESALVDAVGRRTNLDPATSAYPQLVVSTGLAAFQVAAQRAGTGRGALVHAIDEAFDLLTNGLRPPR